MRQTFQIDQKMRKKILHLLIPILSRGRWGKYGFEWKTDQKVEITGVEIAWVKGKNTKSTFKTLKEVQTMNEQDFKLKELEEFKVQQLAKERQGIFELEEKVKKGMGQINLSPKSTSK